MGINELTEHVNNSIQVATKKICLKNKIKSNKIDSHTQNLIKKSRNRESEDYREINKKIKKERTILIKKILKISGGKIPEI